MYVKVENYRILKAGIENIFFTCKKMILKEFG